MLQEKVERLLKEVLAQHSSLFLIKLTVSGDNRIIVVLDGDNGITLQNCVTISRHIEHSLDKDGEQFSLEVTSAGISEPLVEQRQYVKNKGRKLKVKTAGGNALEGVLDDVGPEGIIIRWKQREPKLGGKGKITVTKEAKIDYSDISEAKVIVTF